MAKERFREKILEFKIKNKNNKNSQKLNESAQIGDNVIFDGRKGYIIGKASNGDLLVQIQGSSQFVNPNKVKVIGVKAKVMEPPFKFDEKTQKVLFEQYVKCGIFMGTVPIKTQNCYVKYSQWRDAKLDENVNVISDGELNILPKNNVKVFEDPNDFANPQDYIEGVIIDKISGDAIANILINAIDYTKAIGDSDPVRIIKNPGSDNPQLETMPKSLLRTLSV
ncbi:MAG TPA: hypothetical protein P5513_06795 [Candidatus Diapherotrites archaeon]|nr:hypothetical protein [Candidatus Diapherotrites archaeon]